MVPTSVQHVGRRGRCDDVAVARRAGVVLALGMLVALPAGAAPWRLAGAAPSAPRSEPLSVAGAELVADLSGVDWSLRPGVYGHAADVTAAPDGSLYVLDRRNRAVHRLTPFGAARSVQVIPSDLLSGSWEPRRIDAGPQGLFLLALSVDETRVIHLDAPGGPRLAFHAAIRYNDLAALPSGDLLLSRAVQRGGPTPPPRDPRAQANGGVDRYDVNGLLRGELPREPLAQPIGVDAAPDGRVFVVNRVPVPDAPQATEPPATQEPSRGGSRRWSPMQSVEPINGIVRYDAALRYLDTVPFVAAEDVAAGPGDAFVSRQTEIFRLGDAAPIWGPTSAQVIVPGSGATILRIAQPWSGGRRLHASLNHCHAQGVLSFDLALPMAAPRLDGGLDHPRLSGPILPMRIAGSKEGFRLLQGRTWAVSTPFGEQVGTDQQAGRPQTVQRWSWDGRLRDQLGVCGGLDLPWHADISDAGWALDLAADGAQTYVLGAGSVEARGEPGFPLWTWRPPVPEDGAANPSRLAAVAADAGRVAVLDAGRRTLELLDDDGAWRGGWSLGADGPAPVDIAMRADRVGLAWAAPPRLELRDMAGTILADWPLPDRPRALAFDRDGGPWLLGTGGWIWSLDETGAVRAAFPAPAGRNAVDLAIDPDGRVHVAYARLSPLDPEGAEVLAAGIQVLRPIGAIGSPRPVGPGCTVLVDKQAAPPTLLLGHEVTVRLDQRGHCAPRAAPRRRLILLDHSRSMSWESTLERARMAVLAVLDRLGPDDGPIAAMGFGDDPVLLAPFGADRAALTAALMQLEPSGDTRLGAGLEGAAAALAAAAPSTLPTEVLVFTDGEYKDRLTSGLDAIRAAGATLRVVLVARASLDEATEAGLRRVVGDLGTVDRLPPLPGQGPWLDDVLALRTPATWGEGLRVVDSIPANMAYVDGSAEPTARHDAVARTLTWELPRAAAGEAPTLRFRLRPLETGRWPTNIAATLALTDGWGLAQTMAYPVPEVLVLDRGDLGHRAWLPLVGGRVCWRAQPVDLVLVIDASESMGTPDGPAGERRIDLAVAAAEDLLRGGVNPDMDRLALVTFNAEARLAAPLGADPTVLLSALRGIRLAPGTRLDAGLREAAGALVGRRPEAMPAVILISDGRQADGRAETLAVAAALRDLGAAVYTVGLGADADRALLETIAGEPGRYLSAPRSGDLAAALRAAGERLLCGR